MPRRSFIPAMDVNAPRRKWTLVEVLKDCGKGDGVLALGRWNGKPVLAMRWNGNSNNPIGHPQSRGLPVWFLVPEEFERGILKSITDGDRVRAQKFLDGRSR